MRAPSTAALPLLAILPVVLGGQECYVCVGGEGSAVELERQFPGEALPVCGRGEDAPKLCPPNFLGCLTQYHVDKVIRGCGELNLTVCQKANSVDYCYCSGRLCNSEDSEEEPRSSQEEQKEEGRPPPDDEDLGGEGSGGGGGGGGRGGGGGEEKASTAATTTSTTPATTTRRPTRLTTSAAPASLHTAPITLLLFTLILTAFFE